MKKVHRTNIRSLNNISTHFEIQNEIFSIHDVISNSLSKIYYFDYILLYLLVNTIKFG